MFGVPSSIKDTKDFFAETDEQARLIAEKIYLRQQPHVHGFEIWQGIRLVYREALFNANQGRLSNPAVRPTRAVVP